MNHKNDEVWSTRVHLAAANRLAVYDDLEEGIDNHFTARVPGKEDRYLVLPFGWHWSEAKASDLIVPSPSHDMAMAMPRKPRKTIACLTAQGWAEPPAAE